MDQRELLDYTKKMVERGDPMGNVRMFLKKKSDDKDFINKTMKYLEEYRLTVIADTPPPSNSMIPSM